MYRRQYSPGGIPTIWAGRGRLPTIPQVAIVPYAPRRKAVVKYIPRGMATRYRKGYALAPRAMAEDLNYIDTASSPTALNTTGNVILLNGCVPGTGGSTRTGRRIIMKSFRIKGSLQADTTATYNQVRLSIIYDRQTNAALPAMTDFYDQVGGVNEPWSPISIENGRRFKVLWSGTYDLTGNATTAASGSMQSIDVFKKMNHPVQFNAGTAGNVADIETGGLFLVVVGAQVAGTTDANFWGNIRVRFQP